MTKREIDDIKEKWDMFKTMPDLFEQYLKRLRPTLTFTTDDIYEQLGVIAVSILVFMLASVALCGSTALAVVIWKWVVG